MIKMVVRHEVAASDKNRWIADFEQKKAIREACGISLGCNPIIYNYESGELIVVHEVRATTIRDAIKVLDHIKANAASREKAYAKGEPRFSE